jgi:hypothetical protein
VHGRAAGTLYHMDYGSFSSFWRVVWLMSSSRVDSAMRGSSISFLTRASVAWLDSCLGSFLCIPHDVTSRKGLQVNLEQDCQVSELSAYRAVLNSLDQSAKRSISSVKQRVPFHPVSRTILSRLSYIYRGDEQSQRRTLLWHRGKKKWNMTPITHKPRPKLRKAPLSCLTWKWRKRSSVKITERTYEERAQALHC